MQEILVTQQFIMVSLFKENANMAKPPLFSVTILENSEFQIEIKLFSIQKRNPPLIAEEFLKIEL